MNQLPLEIVNNILIIQYEEQIKELKKQLKSLKFRYDTMDQHYEIMNHYLVSHEVKYCEVCDIYGDDDEIILSEEFGCRLCEYCTEFKEEEKALRTQN